MTDRVRSRLMSNSRGVVTGARVRASIDTGIPAPVLVTVPDIEILEVGENWETSTGVFSWNEEDLLSAISSQDDPALCSPVLKLGHVDERDGFDGQPSFGRLGNLRVKNNNQTLACDLFGVPKWLADVLPTAYPRRSIEGWFHAETKTGNTWPFVLTALALLGAAYPAITTLDDLPLLWGETAPPMVDAEEDEDEQILAEMPSGLIRARRVVTVPTWHSRREAVSAAKGKSGSKVKASTSVSDVTTAYYDSLGPTQYWWWIRQVLVNPFQLVVDDDEGHLYLIDVSVDSNDNITFGEPQEVKVEYVAAVAANLVEVRKTGQVVAASHGDRVAAGAREKPDEEDDDDDDDEEEGTSIVLTDEALQALGLEPGATEEQISAAIVARGQGGGDEPADEPEPVTPATPAAAPAAAPSSTDEPADEPDTPAEPVLAVPDGTVLVDASQWAQVQQGAAAGARIAEENRVSARDSFLADAVKAGKFPRARMQHYTTMWEADPEGTKAMINTFPPGLVPVQERGQVAETDPTVAASAYPEAWKRDPRVVKARNSVSSRVKVVGD